MILSILNISLFCFVALEYPYQPGRSVHCPSCKFVVPDGNSYCLNCGQYLGEATLVRSPPAPFVREISRQPVKPRRATPSAHLSRVVPNSTHHLSWVIVAVCGMGLILVVMLGASQYFFSDEKQTSQVNLQTPSPRVLASPSPKMPQVVVSPSVAVATKATNEQPASSGSTEAIASRSAPTITERPIPGNDLPTINTPPAVYSTPEASSPNEGASLGDNAFTVPALAAKWWVFSIPNGMNRHIQGSITARGGSGNDIQVLIGDENVANGHRGQVWYDSGKVTTAKIDLTLSPGTYYLIFNNRFSLVTTKNVYSDIQIR